MLTTSLLLYSVSRSRFSAGTVILRCSMVCCCKSSSTGWSRLCPPNASLKEVRRTLCKWVCFLNLHSCVTKTLCWSFSVLNSMSDREFNDSRRRGLQRFMTLVIRHPVLAGDELVNIFLSASSAVSPQTSRWQYNWFIFCPNMIIVVCFEVHPFCVLQEVQNMLRDAYKKTGDEFLTSQMALHGKVG